MKLFELQGDVDPELAWTKVMEQSKEMALKLCEQYAMENNIELYKLSKPELKQIYNIIYAKLAAGEYDHLI